MTPYYLSQDSRIAIYYGDCRDVLPRLEAVDLVVTDPPYSVSQKGMVQVGRRGKGQRRLDFFAGDDNWQESTQRAVDGVVLASRLLLPHGSVYAWVGHRQLGAVCDALEGEGYSTRFLVWRKECPPPAAPGSGWSSGAELCLYGYRPGRKWNHWSGAPVNVLTADSYRFGQPGKVDHPTQKPFGVIRPLLEASSSCGDLVLDPFMGSGTTLVVAKQLSRRAIGIEIEERFCQMAADRLRQEVMAL